MCVIVHVNAKKSIAKETLRDCFFTNRDGWGIMWAHNDKLHMVKDKTHFDDFYDIWKDVPRDAERAIHFRIRTAGEINKANCHPFAINENIAMMHNGMIDAVMLNDKMSDTYNFVENELKPIVSKWPDFMKAQAFSKLMGDVTGHSKLLFMNNKGDVLKIRENVWVERNGIYFSNSNSFRTYNYGAGYNYNRNYSPPALNHSHNRNDYTPLKDRIAAVDESQDQYSEDSVVSDLYSGNKTAAQGEAYLDALETERLANLAANVAAPPDSEVADPDDIEEADEEEEYGSVVPSVEDVCNWSDQDTMDWMADYPKAALLFLHGLIGTVIQVKAIDVADGYIGSEISRRSAVTG